MRNTAAIFQKQIKDTFKNKAILIQFIMFPVMAVIMEKSIKIEGMPAHYFADMFSAMYVGMAPLVSIAAVIAEEKEKNTLRVLMMSGVKPWEYLLAVGSYIWSFCMAGALVLGIAGGHKGHDLLIFLLVMAAGILASLLIGAAIGTASRNQMMATSITVPVMLVFSFLPMLAEFNDTISKAARAVYSRQIGLLIGSVEDFCPSFENISVICLNMLAALLLFGYAYKKSGLA